MHSLESAQPRNVLGRIAHIVILLAVGLALACVASAHAAKDVDKSTVPTRKVDIVYDTSGSMITDNAANPEQGSPIDRWCQAKYAVEVVGGMLDDKVSLSIYDTSAQTDDPWIAFSGKGVPAADKVKKIHEETPNKTKTEFRHVRDAAADLAGSAEDQKWLVVFTDGKFYDNGNKLDAPAVGAELSGFAKKGANIVYLSIGDEGALMAEDFDSGVNVVQVSADGEARAAKQGRGGTVYLANAAHSEDTLPNMQKIASIVSGRHEIASGDSVKSFKTVTSMSDVVVFAQGAGIASEQRPIKLTGPDGKEIPARSQVQVEYSKVPARNLEGIEKSKVVYNDRLQGVIVTFADDNSFPAGEYKLESAQEAHVSVYYMPDIVVRPVITNTKTGAAWGLSTPGNGDDSYLVAGDSTIGFKFYDRQSGEAIEDTSQFGDDITYKAVFSYDGMDPIDVQDGESVSLEEGNAKVTTSANIFGDTTVTSTFKGVEIVPALDIAVTLTGPDSFSVTDIDEWPGGEVPEYEVTVTKGDGSELDADQWAALEDLKVESSNENVTWVADRVDESAAPTVKLHPVYTPAFPNGLPLRMWQDVKPLGDADLTVDVRLPYQKQLGVGHAEQVVQVGRPTGLEFLVNAILLAVIVFLIVWFVLYMLTRKKLCKVKGEIRYQFDGMPSNSLPLAVRGQRWKYPKIPFKAHQVVKYPFSGDCEYAQVQGGELKLKAVGRGGRTRAQLKCDLPRSCDGGGRGGSAGLKWTWTDNARGGDTPSARGTLDGGGVSLKFKRSGAGPTKPAGEIEIIFRRA